MLSDLSVRSLSRLLLKRKISAVELTATFLGRIHQSDTFNCLIETDYKLSILQAIEADKMIGRGHHNTLVGIPIVFKDVLVSLNQRSDACSAMLENHAGAFNASVIKKCRASGMVNLGKTNMDEFSMGSTGESSCLGSTISLQHKHLAAGGSSSGSAVAVSARLAPCAIGSDTGGSVRQPSHFASLSSLKPTYSRTSRHGMVSFSSSLDAIGVIARSVEDCAIIQSAVSGWDPKDSTSSFCKGEDLSRLLGAPWDLKNRLPHKPLSTLKLGVFTENIECSLVPSEMRRSFSFALAGWEELGAEVLVINCAELSLPNLFYQMVSSAEASSNLSRYDGTRFGRCQMNSYDFDDEKEQARTWGPGVEVKKRIIRGNDLLLKRPRQSCLADWSLFQERMFNSINHVFMECDAILSLVCPLFPPLAHKGRSMFGEALVDAFTSYVNLTGLPAISLCYGSAEYMGSSIPLGFQLIGRPFGEAKLLQIAHTYQSAWNVPDREEVNEGG